MPHLYTAVLLIVHPIYTIERISYVIASHPRVTTWNPRCWYGLQGYRFLELNLEPFIPAILSWYPCSCRVWVIQPCILRATGSSLVHGWSGHVIVCNEAWDQTQWVALLTWKIIWWKSKIFWANNLESLSSSSDNIIYNSRHTLPTNIHSSPYIVTI